MPIFRKGDIAVLYVHVPKTGGTSIENLFTMSGWEVHLLDRGRPGTLNPYRRCSPQHMHASALLERLRPETFNLVFMTVREPLARFRSEVVMRNPGLEQPWSKDVQRWTQDILRRYLANPYALDNHLRPQSEFYIPGSRVWKLEDGLVRVVEELRTVHGLDLADKVPHTMTRAGTLSAGGVKPPSEIEEQVIDIYRDDYARLDYPLPTMQIRRPSD